MNPKSIAKWVDIIGIGSLTIFLFLSLAFRASSISFMDPGFPILSNSDWTPVPSITLNWNEYPQRYNSKESFSEVAYLSKLQLDDTSQMFPNPYTPARIEPTNFTGFQTVIRYSETNYALSAIQSHYDKYIGDLKPYQHLILDIPGLEFSGKADQYYI